MSEQPPLHDADLYGSEPLLHVNIEAEQAVLGSILLNNQTFWKVDSWLDPGHFYDPLHQRIYAEMVEVIHKGEVADPITLNPKFSQDEAMIDIGGVQYLSRLVAASVSGNPVPYGKNVVDLYRRRRLGEVSSNLKDLSDNTDINTDEMIERSETELADLADDSRGQTNIRSMSELVSDTLQAATDASQREDGIVGISTGLDKLDAVLGGLRGGNFIVIGGRPGMGKSALAVVLAVNAAKISLETGAGYGVAFLSLEMEGEEITFRAFSMGATRYDIWHPYSEIMRGIYNESQMDAIGRASSDLSDLPLFIEDTGRKTVSSMQGIARTIDREFQKRGSKLGLLIIDHMGIAKPAKAYEGYKVAEMTQISNDLKSTAKQLHIPVIALHQLSRSVESREDKRPHLSDLRDSGSIEQDADVVLFTYREAYYKQKEEPDFHDIKHKDWVLELDEIKDDMNIIIAKNRHGPEANLKFFCDVSCNVIWDHNPGRFEKQGSFEMGDTG